MTPRVRPFIRTEAIITIYGTGELKGAPPSKRMKSSCCASPRRTARVLGCLAGRPARVVRYAINARREGAFDGHEGLLFFRFDASGAITEEHRYQDSLTPMAQLGACVRPPFAPCRICPPRSPDTPSHVRRRTDRRIDRHGHVCCDERGPRIRRAVVFDVNPTIDEVFLPQPFSGKDAPAAW